MHQVREFFYHFIVVAEKALLEKRKIIDRLPSIVSSAFQHETTLLIKQHLRRSRDERTVCSSEVESQECADTPSTIMIVIEKPIDFAML